MITYYIVFMILLILELLYFKIADKCNIIDRPNERSSHKNIVLRGGGIIFLFGVWLYAALYGFNHVGFLLGMTMIGGVSFVDDIYSLPNRYRLLIQFIAMGLLFYDWGILNLDAWWMIGIALIICTGIINAYNFMDGINGITGGYSLVVLLSLFLVNQEVGFISKDFIVVVMLSVVVFCFFNFRKKAKCFAGDVGSVSLAFIILFLLGALLLNTHNLWYIVFLAVYGVDSVLTICHRLILHENIFGAHRKHVYQLLANELSIPHVVVASFYMLLQLAVSLGVIYLPVNKWTYSIVVVIVLCIAYILFKRKYYYLHEAYLHARINQNN